MQNLYDKLTNYCNSDRYPFHMPGHKRCKREYPFTSFYQLDITEVENFDNLHHPMGILMEIQQKAATFFGTKQTFYLVNGSTSGNLSAISAIVPMGGKIILSRNSHKSAYHACYLRNLDIQYIYPEYVQEYSINGGINPNDIIHAIEENMDASAIFITSPTTDGIISDVKKIADICHRYGKILIVDEAHGSHLGQTAKMPLNAIQNDADIVIHSLHKTLPSLTQTALLHVNSDRVDLEKLQYYLSIYQTSSPSYLLMASIDQCIEILMKEKEDLYARFFYYKSIFDKNISKLSNLSVMNSDILGKYSIKAIDPGKILISTKGINLTGPDLYQLLEQEYDLQLEMANSNSVLAIATIMDEEMGFCRLAEALISIDSNLNKVNTR